MYSKSSLIQFILLLFRENEKEKKIIEEKKMKTDTPF